MFSSDSIQIEDSEGLTKLDIRQKVWKHFQDNDLANFPLSVFRRIPNFKGADEAGAKLAELECFKAAKSVKVNLDKPQGEVRFLTLQAGKVLLVPTPGLRTGLFNRMDSTSAGSDTTENLRLLAQNDGMKRHSTSLDLDADAKVDLVVVGSVAVSRTGHRIGKGEGFVDLEYGMMRHMKCVNEYTLIVTTVHDCQVFDSLPERLFAVHDVPVDLIVTPTQVLPVSKRANRPAGILWDLIDADKFYRVAILRTLWQRLKDAGQEPRIKGEDPVPSEEQIADYWKKVEATREANREARVASRRGGGRGRRGFRRGRGGRRYEGGEDGPVDEDGNRLQVTVSVNKRNRIVRRSVRSANQMDREGDANLNDGQTNGDGEDMPARGRGRSRYNRRGRSYYGQPPFSVFLGNVPPHSRTREIKEAVKEVIEDKARGVDIQRRTYAGFAFLRFSRIDADHADEVVSALQGLKILDQEVVVEKARTKSSRSEGEQNGDAGYGNEEGGGAGGGYRGGRGGRRGGKRYRGGRRGRGGFAGRDDRRRKRDDEEGGSGYEDEGREYREPNQGAAVPPAPAGDAGGEEASSNWEK